MNDLLLVGNTNLTMSSREIAELVGSRHDNVRTAVERLAEKGVIALPAMQEKATAGRPSLEYVFSGEQGKRDSIVVVAQLSPEFTARLVDRWQELEAQVAAQPALDPKNLSRMQLIELALDAERERLALAEKVDVLTPKADALDRIATVSDGSLCLRDAAKQLQLQPKQFNLWMQANKWIYKRAGGSNFIGYQDRIQSGLLEHKAHIVIDEAGNERLRDQVRVTAKGLTRLAALLQAEVA